MKQVKRIIIVGHPGAGKGVLSKAIAERLQWDLIDADYGLELKTGLLITEIIGEQGNAALRDCENKLINAYSTREGCVIITDAGIILSEKNRVLLKEAYVVFVDVSLTMQLERFRRGVAPLMPDSDRKALLEGIHERDDLFMEVANITVNTDDGDVDAHVNRVLADAKIDSHLIGKNYVKLDNCDLIQLHNITYQSVQLSEQQAVCLKLLAHGKSAKEIAKDLVISYRTVEGHLATVMALLGCASSKELISLYLRGQP